MHALSPVDNHEYKPSNTAVRLLVLADLEHSSRVEM
jgi:hypothetical protein